MSELLSIIGLTVSVNQLAKLFTGPTQVRIYGENGHLFEENYFLSDGIKHILKKRGDQVNDAIQIIESVYVRVLLV